MATKLPIDISYTMMEYLPTDTLDKLLITSRTSGVERYVILKIIEGRVDKYAFPNLTVRKKYNFPNVTYGRKFNRIKKTK